MQETDDKGETVETPIPYNFEAGQLQSTDGAAQSFAVELLEDGNIVVSLFVPGEGDVLKCISVFMVRAE